ncbi:unnamed protein product [Diabrotica balteata]|uniref:L-dopachrome isomerase n=1 Tax=Diabrotica balteata TaxID=107213 RepID=A0A9N9T353_DIABA|nr:unnamed protein product [Diabrotica balteata]
MPHFKVETNIPNDKIPDDLPAKLSNIISKSLGKPINYCVATVVGGVKMSWGGDNEPAAQAVLMSIGALGVDENKKHAKVLFECISKSLGIPEDRVETNIPNDKIPDDLPAKLCGIISKSLGKPINYCCATVVGGVKMSWGGDNEPAAQAVLMSIGALGVEENKKHAKVLFDCISKSLGIPVDRKRVDLIAQTFHDRDIAASSKGKHTNRLHRKSKEILKNVSFPRRESNYSRIKSRRFYLSPDLNVKKKHQLYLELYEPESVSNPKYKSKVPYDFYYRYFKKNFNYRFLLPLSDTCKKCDVLDNKLCEPRQK